MDSIAIPKCTPRFATNERRIRNGPCGPNCSEDLGHWKHWTSQVPSLTSGRQRPDEWIVFRSSDSSGGHCRKRTCGEPLPFLESLPEGHWSGLWSGQTGHSDKVYLLARTNLRRCRRAYRWPTSPDFATSFRMSLQKPLPQPSAIRESAVKANTVLTRRRVQSYVRIVKYGKMPPAD